ncbi:MAG TPA: MDR family MFS transporter [Acidimicrobiia bacterium]|nr:MDR family MFS transporter [Acidimicrobiia bacterium]
MRNIPEAIRKPVPTATDSTARGFVVVFIGLQVGMMMSGIDGTIVATALPSISRDLGGVSSIAWVVSAYLLFQVATMPLYGKLGDLHGRKRVLLFAIGLFVLGSVACGLAQSLPQLLVARAVQGVGGGGLPVLGMAILGDLVPPRQLGRWLGYQGMLFAVAIVIGPLVGGLFVDHLSWRWAFFINVPFAIVAVAILVPRLHLPFRRVEHAIDYLGSALLTVALAALVVLATAGGKDVDWISPESGALVLVLLVCSVAFVWRERHAAEPFVPLRLFQNTVVRIAAPVNFTSGLLFYLGVFFLPVFFQEVAGVDATASGLLLIPFMIGTAASTTFAGNRVERTGRYRTWPILGGVAMTIGALALTTIGLDTSVAVVAAFGTIVGIGVGFAMQTSILAVQNAVDVADLGMATSTALLARTLGGTIGTPLFGAVLAAGVPAHHATAADFADALPWVFASAVPVGLLAILFGCLLPQRPLRGVGDGSEVTIDTFIAPH